MDYVRYWADRSQVGKGQIVKGIGLSTSKFYDWQQRYGKANEHNAKIPRNHWLEDWEREAIIQGFYEHPGDGYRRLRYMLMDADVVAVSPSTTYRVLKSAGLLQRWNQTQSRKGSGFHQPDRPHQHWHIDISYVNRNYCAVSGPEVLRTTSGLFLLSVSLWLRQRSATPPHRCRATAAAVFGFGALRFTHFSSVLEQRSRAPRLLLIFLNHRGLPHRVTSPSGLLLQLVPTRLSLIRSYCSPVLLVGNCDLGY